jgi:hypothetical protein
MLQIGNQMHFRVQLQPQSVSTNTCCRAAALPTPLAKP